MGARKGPPLQNSGSQFDLSIGAGIPYARDIPDKFDLYYVETPRTDGPFGAAGVGEIPLTAPHVAIVNAIKNATGVRITHLPARPEKILAGLKALKPELA